MEETIEQKVVALYRSGKSLRDIVAELHIDHYAAWQALVKSGLDQKVEVEKPSKTCIKKKESTKNRKYAKYDKQVVEQIKSLREQGYTAKQICEQFGYSNSQVYRYLKKLGMITTPRQRAEEVVKKAIDLRLQGYSYKEISDVVNRSPATLARYFSSEGIVKTVALTPRTMDDVVSSIQDTSPDDVTVSTDSVSASDDLKSLEEEFERVCAKLEQVKRKVELARNISEIKKKIYSYETEIRNLGC